MSTANTQQPSQEGSSRPVPPHSQAFQGELASQAALAVNSTPLSPTGRRARAGPPRTPPPLSPDAVGSVDAGNNTNSAGSNGNGGQIVSPRERPLPVPQRVVSPPPKRPLPSAPGASSPKIALPAPPPRLEATTEQTKSSQPQNPLSPRSATYHPREAPDSTISSRLGPIPNRKAPSPMDASGENNESKLSTTSQSSTVPATQPIVDKTTSHRTLDLSPSDIAPKNAKGGSRLGIFTRNAANSVGDTSNSNTSNSEQDRLKVHFKYLEDPEKQRLYTRTPMSFAFSSHRDRVGFEVYTSELSYNTCMHLLVDVFKTTLISAVKAGHVQLKQETVVAIFGQIESVLKTSDILLDEFEKRMRQWEGEDESNGGRILGDIFVKFGDILKVYASFASSQQNSKLAQEVSRNSRSYHAMLKIAQTFPACQARDLQSLLIMPIQRIPRYELLLRDFLKVTSSEHPDYAYVSSALLKIKTVAELVDRAVEEYKEIERLLDIQRSFAPGSEPIDLVVPGRRFIKDGSLIKVCRRANKTRKFWLFNDLLLYGIPILTGSAVVSGVFPLKHLQLQDLPDAQEEDSNTNSTISTHQLQRLSLMPGSIQGDYSSISSHTSKDSIGSTHGSGNSIFQNGNSNPANSASSSSHSSLSPGTSLSPSQIGLNSNNQGGSSSTNGNSNSSSSQALSATKKPIFQFMIQTRTKSFVVIATSIQEKADWMVAIMTAAAQCHEAAKSIAPNRLNGASNNNALSDGGKHDVAPAWVPDALAPRCKLCSVDFGLVTRRHHCRHCGDVVCDDCSKHRVILPGLDKNAVRVCNNCIQSLGYGSYGGFGSANTNQKDATTTKEKEKKEDPPFVAPGINLLAGLVPPPKTSPLPVHNASAEDSPRDE